MDLDFFWDKKLTASKSELIRAYCLKSWNPQIEIIGAPSGEDTLNMANALNCFLQSGKNKNYFCGDSALMIRTWAARLSRLPHRSFLEASQRLLERPHGPLWDVLKSLGCSVSINSKQIELQSQGWDISKTHVFVDSAKSSQYLSALALNSWSLNQDMTWDYADLASPAYLNMTLTLVKKFGMEFETEQNKIHIKKNQKPKTTNHVIEPDMSTAFAVSAWAALGGKAHFDQFPAMSLQPDFEFIKILKQMGAKIKQDSSFTVEKTQWWHTVDLDLSSSPDLFPVLSVLCSFADGISRIRSIKQLAWKESNRITQAIKLIEALGRRAEYNNDVFEIYGKKLDYVPKSEITFNPDHDHRWVMAAQAARYAGFNIKILNPTAINKTAPELLSYVC